MEIRAVHQWKPCLAAVLVVLSYARAAEPAHGIARLDTDHDGRISLEEFYPTGPPPLHPRMKRVFESFDKEHRGSLSYEDTRRVIATVSGLMPKFAPETDGAFDDIPLEVSPRSGRAVITATINGVAGRFLLDTGTSDTILDTAFARAAGVDFVEICTPIISGNYGRKGDIISLVRVPDLQIAGTHFRDFHAVLRDDGAPRSDFPGRLAGIIGGNVLFVKPVTLDYGNARLSFSNRVALPSDLVLDLLPSRPKTPAVDVEIDGVKVVLMFDSGAAIGDALLINQPYHAALRKLVGDDAAAKYQAAEIRAAGKLLAAGKSCLLRDFEESVIGSRFFERHVITIDKPAGRIRIAE